MADAWGELCDEAVDDAPSPRASDEAMTMVAGFFGGQSFDPVVDDSAMDASSVSDHRDRQFELDGLDARSSPGLLSLRAARQVRAFIA